MDESPPIFLLGPSSICWGPLQGVLLSAGSGTHRTKPFGRSPVVCALWDLLVGVQFSLGEGRTRAGAGSPAGSSCWGGSWENQQKKMANWKISLQLCCCFLQERGHQALCLPVQAAGQPQIIDACDLHHLHLCHLPGYGDQPPLLVALGYLSQGGGTLPRE